MHEVDATCEIAAVVFHDWNAIDLLRALGTQPLLLDDAAAMLKLIVGFYIRISRAPNKAESITGFIRTLIGNGKERGHTGCKLGAER
jgi:hypothetical protein